MSQADMEVSRRWYCVSGRPPGIEQKMEELPAGRSRDARGRRCVGPPPVDGNSQAKDYQSEKGRKWPSAF